MSWKKRILRRQRLVFGGNYHFLRDFSEFVECILGSPGDGVWGKELWLGDSMATVLSYYKPAPSLEVLILPMRQSLGFRLVIPTLGTLDPWISIEIL